MSPRPRPKKPTKPTKTTKQKQAKAGQKRGSRTDPHAVLPARIDGETDIAYDAFCAYISVLPHRRSLRRVAEDLGYTNANTVTKWCSVHRWLERARPFDDARRSTVLAAIEQQRIDEALADARTDAAVRESARRDLADPAILGSLRVLILDSSTPAAVRVTALQQLCRIAGIDHFRKAELTLLARPPAPPAPAPQPDLDNLTVEQLLRLSGGGPLVDDPPEPDREPDRG